MLGGLTGARKGLYGRRHRCKVGRDFENQSILI